MRFDVLIKHRNFDSVAQMLHKKSHSREINLQSGFFDIFREADFFTSSHINILINYNTI